MITFTAMNTTITMTKMAELHQPVLVPALNPSVLVDHPTVSVSFADLFLVCMLGVEESSFSKSKPKA